MYANSIVYIGIKSQTITYDICCVLKNNASLYLSSIFTYTDPHQELNQCCYLTLSKNTLMAQFREFKLSA